MLIEFMDLYVVCGVAWFLRGLVRAYWVLNLGNSPEIIKARNNYKQWRVEVAGLYPDPGLVPLLNAVAWTFAICYLALTSVFWPITVALYIKKASS